MRKVDLVVASWVLNSVASVCRRLRWVGISLAPCTQDTFEPAGCKMDDEYLNICSLISLLLDTLVCVLIPANFFPLHGFLEMENTYIYGVLQKVLYNFESFYKFIQRTYTVF
jgi:hypothetical protein